MADEKKTATYELSDKKWEGSIVTVYPSIDGIFQNAGGYDYVLTNDTPQKVLQYLFNIEHPAVKQK